MAFLQGLLGGADNGAGSLWSHPLIAQFAFNARSAPKQYGENEGRVRDGTIDVGAEGDKAKVGYRLYLPETTDGEKTGVVLYFHGNAEVCTDLGMFVDMFHKSNYAVLSVDYRGYGWSTGSPSLTKLCPDAADIARAAPAILATAGVRGPIVTIGRSIGAASAVHVAANSAKDGLPAVAGLVVDSGLMSITELPMVSSIVMMLGPAGAQLLQNSPDPMNTLAKCKLANIPALVLHGERDEIVPVKQAHDCANALPHPRKRKLIFPTASHNDVLIVAGREWSDAVSQLLRGCLGEDVGAAPPPASAPAPSEDDLRAMSIKELKALCASRGVSTAGCSEKIDLVNALLGKKPL